MSAEYAAAEAARVAAETARVAAETARVALGRMDTHEATCALRYEAIALDAAHTKQGIDKLQTSFDSVKKWVAGLISALAVALIVMYIQNAATGRERDEADRRAMESKLTALSTQMQAAQRAPGTLVVTPQGMQTETRPKADDAVVDQALGVPK